MSARRPYIPKGCDYQGRYPQAAEACTELGADTPTLAAAPGLWGRLRRAWRRWDLRTRIAGLEALQDELRCEIADLRACFFAGSDAAARLAVERISANGQALDDAREQTLRLRAQLARLQP